MEWLTAAPQVLRRTENKKVIVERVQAVTSGQNRVPEGGQSKYLNHKKIWVFDSFF